LLTSPLAPHSLYLSASRLPSSLLVIASTDTCAAQHGGAGGGQQQTFLAGKQAAGADWILQPPCNALARPGLQQQTRAAPAAVALHICHCLPRLAACTASESHPYCCY
jgi:hypothetical protein